MQKGGDFRSRDEGESPGEPWLGSGRQGFGNYEQLFILGHPVKYIARGQWAEYLGTGRA